MRSVWCWWVQALKAICLAKCGGHDEARDICRDLMVCASGRSVHRAVWGFHDLLPVTSRAHIDLELVRRGLPACLLARCTEPEAHGRGRVLCSGQCPGSLWGAATGCGSVRGSANACAPPPSRNSWTGPCAVVVPCCEASRSPLSVAPVVFPGTPTRWLRSRTPSPCCAPCTCSTCRTTTESSSKRFVGTFGWDCACACVCACAGDGMGR